MNEHETAARFKKANAFVIALNAGRIPAGDVANISDDQWKQIAKAIDVNPPSEATIALIETQLRALQTPLPADPFKALRRVK